MDLESIALQPVPNRSAAPLRQRSSPAAPVAALDGTACPRPSILDLLFRPLVAFGRNLPVARAPFSSVNRFPLKPRMMVKRLNALAFKLVNDEMLKRTND
jgi:hypothetical protein